MGIRNIIKFPLEKSRWLTLRVTIFVDFFFTKLFVLKPLSVKQLSYTYVSRSQIEISSSRESLNLRFKVYYDNFLKLELKFFLNTKQAENLYYIWLLETVRAKVYIGFIVKFVFFLSIVTLLTPMTWLNNVEFFRINPTTTSIQSYLVSTFSVFVLPSFYVTPT